MSRPKPDKQPGKGAGLTWRRVTAEDGTVTYTLFWRDASNRVRQHMLVCCPRRSRPEIALQLHLMRLSVHAQRRAEFEAVAA